MFEFTNEQRKCFGLTAVDRSWERVKVKPSPYDDFSTYAYLDGNRVEKVLLICEDPAEQARYQEFRVNAVLSDDRSMMLPRTEKGKPRPFSSSNLLKGAPVGMAFAFASGQVFLKNCSTEQAYLRFEYDDLRLDSFASFIDWVQKWCEETGEKERKEIEAFAAAERMRQKYREGDFFRFRLSRKLFGYGRLLIDFGKMRKENIPFWDVFMGKPLCVAVYHMATERDDMTPRELEGLPTLPPQMIMDNALFYGEHTIVGNLPVQEADWDFPIHYGRPLGMLETGVRYQCGRTYIALDHEQALYGRFRNNGIGWMLHVKKSILQKCMETGSNQPYWELSSPRDVDADLRNPKFSEARKRIERQITPSARVFTADSAESCR